MVIIIFKNLLILNKVGVGDVEAGAHRVTAPALQNDTYPSC
jgi:hypothetical protein